jgi:hypothetical protein
VDTEKIAIELTPKQLKYLASITDDFISQIKETFPESSESIWNEYLQEIELLAISLHRHIREI